jgi:hypothetical protein
VAADRADLARPTARPAPFDAGMIAGLRDPADAGD